MQQNPAVELPIADVPIGVTPGWRQIVGRAPLRRRVPGDSSLSWLFSSSRRFGLTTVGFENWRPVAVAFVAWSVCLCVSLVLTRGQRGEQAVFLLASRPHHRRLRHFSHDLRPVHRLPQLESERCRRTAVHRSGQFPPAILRPRILGRHAEHGVLRRRRPGAIRHRLWTCDSLESTDPRTQVFPCCLSPTIHAEPGRRQLHDRQVAAQ